MSEQELREQDKTYQDAGLWAVGYAIAQMFKGLRDGGMDRKEALSVTLVYAKGLSEQRQERAE